MNEIVVDLEFEGTHSRYSISQLFMESFGDIRNVYFFDSKESDFGILLRTILRVKSFKEIGPLNESQYMNYLNVEEKVGQNEVMVALLLNHELELTQYEYEEWQECQFRGTDFTVSIKYEMIDRFILRYSPSMSDLFFILIAPGKKETMFGLPRKKEGSIYPE